jgi:hypothetical protein
MNIPSNSLYVDTVLGPLPKEDRQACLDAMEKYGKNRWWLSEDPKERAYHQVNEPILLMSFSQFHEDVENLLNRSVWTHEFASDKLKHEAERAWKYGVGATSDKERKERFEESVKDLKDKGKNVILIKTEE